MKRTSPRIETPSPPTSAKRRFRRPSSVAICASAASGLVSVITFEPATEHLFDLLIGGAGVAEAKPRSFQSNPRAHRAEGVAGALLGRGGARTLDVIASERIHVDDVFRTHANTWSNLAYVIVGLYALALGVSDQRSRPARAGGYVIQTPAMSLLFGAACCYLGFGSGLYHASLTSWGQQLDVAAMYVPLLACLAMHLGRWACAARGQWEFPAAPIWPVLTGLVVVTSYLLYRYKWSMSASVVLTTLILLVGLLGLLDVFFARHRMRFRWLGWSSVALFAAITCRQLDVAGKFSGPDAWFQGHAIWHVLTALSLACLYAYYRCEVSSGPSAAQSLRSYQT